METIEDIFSKLPKEYGGLVVAACGALFLIGAIRRWKWTLDMTGQRSAHPFGFLTLMQEWFGDEGVRVGTIIISVIILIGGIAMFVVMKCTD